MNLDFLKTFLRVVERGSFTLAAEDLSLTQPGVSFQIRSLEEEYGVELLDRSGREVIPTASGAILVAYGRQIIDAFEESQQEIERLNHLLRGSLVIGASTGPGEHLLPQLLGRFKQRHPQIDIVLQISRTDEIIHEVLTRKLELGIVGAKTTEDALIFEPFIKDELVIIASPDEYGTDDKPTCLDELLDEPFILQQKGAGIRTMFEAGLIERGLSLENLNIYMELGLQESVKKAVAEGFGVGIISRFAVREELKLGTLTEIAIADLPRFRDEFYLVRNRRRKLSLLTETFLTFSAEHLDTLT